MFYRYEIRNNQKEDILYLYMTINYEFSKELDNDKNDSDLKENIIEFINNNSINFKGNKIYLIVDGIIVKTIEFENDNIKEIEENIDYSNDKYVVNLKYENKIIKLTLKRYLLGVVATNAMQDLELSTIKALTLLYRTYAYKKMNEDNLIEAENMFQIYKPISYYKVIWGEEFTKIYNKLLKAIDDTDKEFVTYNDKYILPFIHICNNGITSKSNDYPYLEARESLWDYASPYYIEVKDFSYKEIKDKLKLKDKNIRNIKINGIDKTNNIKEIIIDNTTFPIKLFRNILELKSSDISIIINPTFIRFITKGWGDGYGLSQHGANEIAKTNASYISIIKYYFPSIEIKKYK